MRKGNLELVVHGENMPNNILDENLKILAARCLEKNQTILTGLALANYNGWEKMCDTFNCNACPIQKPARYTCISSPDSRIRVIAMTRGTTVPDNETIEDFFYFVELDQSIQEANNENKNRVCEQLEFDLVHS